MTYEIIQRTTVYDYDDLYPHAQERAWFAYVATESYSLTQTAFDDLQASIDDFCKQANVKHDWYNAHGPGTERSSFKASSVYDEAWTNLPLENDGSCYSMDIVDAWNGYIEEHKEAWNEAVEQVMSDWNSENPYEEIEAQTRLEAMVDEALQEVSKAIDAIWEAEKDYLTSKEYFEEYIAPENWYTCDGLTAYPHDRFDAIAC